MKLHSICFFIAIFIVQSSNIFAKAPEPIDYVNVEKFSGLWYEIARTYNDFEKDCVGSTVEYTLVEPLKYNIKNRCFDTTFEGAIIQYNGVAKPTNENNMNKTDMTYFWIFTNEYRIIYLDDKYETAVMVNKSMENVWIMNRKPFMKQDKLDKIVSFLAEYMNISTLIYTPHKNKSSSN